MSVMWTNEQQKVIDLRNRNILVSAAAGSGKTAVLVERIIKMLTSDENPIDVDRLLIVTFTEAAASEMKERIRAAIEKELEEYPDNEHLKQQATMIHSSRITTIHSFCLSVIRDHFHAIDIDPGFRIGEEGELNLLRHDVLETVLEEKYQKKEKRFLDFSVAYGSRKNDKKIEELILKIYEFSRSYPDAKGWLSSCVDSYGIETEKEWESSEFAQFIKNNVQKYLEEAQVLLHQGEQICCQPDGPAVYATTLSADMQMIESLMRMTTYQEMAKAISEIRWTKLAANRDKTVSEEKAKQVKVIRDEVKGLVKDVAEQYFVQDINGILEDIQMCRPAMEELAELVEIFADRFEEKKREKNMIDFSDMEQYALQILTEQTPDGFVPSVIAKEYQKQFLEIMIDEYQDSNLIQETILTSISTLWEVLTKKGKENIIFLW